MEIIVKGVVPVRVLVTDEEAERIRKRDEAYRKSELYQRFREMRRGDR